RTAPENDAMTQVTNFCSDVLPLTAASHPRLSPRGPALISRLSNHRALRRRLRRRGGWRQGQHCTSAAAHDLGENTVVDAGGGIGIAADDQAPFVNSIERSKRRARKIIGHKLIRRPEDNAVRRARRVG